MEFVNVMPYFLLLFSFTFVGMAGYVFWRKKPMIYNSRWNLLMMAFVFVPMVIQNITISIELGESFELMSIFPLAMIVVMMFWYWYMFKGFLVFGADVESLQQTFLKCLNNKGLTYEQSLSSIKILEPEVEIAVSAQSWIGSVQFRSKSKEGHLLLKDVIGDLKKETNKSNFITPIFYASIGIIMCIVSLSMILNPIDTSFK